MKFGFCILHYRAEKDTIKCVESILSLYENYDCCITIVDNCSPDGSGNRLKERYKDYFNVFVLCLPKNEGYARGNNAGITYLNINEKCDFVIAVNNDTLFIQDDFLEKIIHCYSKYHFDVLGPDILDSERKEHTSPLDLNLLSYAELSKQIHQEEFFNFVYKKNYREKIYNLILSIKHFFFGIRKKSDENDKNTYFTDNVFDCVLQGSCIIFSRDYLRRHDSAFYPETFLYYEEYILTYLVLLEKGIIMYTPQIKIVHIGDQATNEQFSDVDRNKRNFTLAEALKSKRILLKLMTMERVNY